VEVDEVMFEPEYFGTLHMIIQALKIERSRLREEACAEEARQQQRLDEEKAVGKSKIDAKLREMLGMPVLTTEERQKQITMADRFAAAGVEQTHEQPIPEAVTQLTEKFREKLPGFVFKHAVPAVTFRGWLGFHVKPVNSELARTDIHDEYRQALAQRKLEFQDLFEAIGEVIDAWGLDTRVHRTENPDFVEVRRRLEKPESRFYRLTKLPQVEKPEEKAVREQAEAEARTAKEADQAAKAALRDKLIERLLGLDLTDLNKEKLFKEQAEAMANRIVKFYRKLASEGIDAMFRLAAIDKKCGSKTEGDDTTALIYAKAGNMSAEELETTVNARKQLHAGEIQNEGNRRQAKGFGEEKPETAKARNNNGKKPKNKDGNKPRSNGRKGVRSDSERFNSKQ
jgi:hypothetical protein